MTDDTGRGLLHTGLNAGRSDTQGIGRLSRRSLILAGAAGLGGAAALGGPANAAFADVAYYLPLAGGTMTGPIAGFQDKGGQVFNVMAYGAKGDGSTDDTAAIQTAINAAAAALGVVYFPATSKAYMFSNLTLYAYVVLQGVSPLKSLLQRIPGSTGSAITEAATDNPDKAVGIQIKNIGVYGAGTAGDGINLGNVNGNFSSNAYLEHVLVYGFPSGSGFNLNGNAIWFADLWSNNNKNGFTLVGEANFYYGLWAQFNSGYEIHSSEPWSHFSGIQIENFGTSGTNPCLLISGNKSFFQGLYINWGTGVSPGGIKPGLISIDSNITYTIIRNVVVVGGGAYTNTVRSVAHKTGCGVQSYITEYDFVSGAIGLNWHQNSSDGTITQHD